mgnify:CR=1 FL=1
MSNGQQQGGIIGPRQPAYTKKSYSGFGQGGQNIMAQRDWTYPEYNLWEDLAGAGMKVIEQWMGLNAFKDEHKFEVIKTDYEQQKAEFQGVVTAYTKGKEFGDNYLSSFVPSSRPTIITGWDIPDEEEDDD